METKTFLNVWFAVVVLISGIIPVGAVTITSDNGVITLLSHSAGYSYPTYQACINAGLTSGQCEWPASAVLYTENQTLYFSHGSMYIGTNTNIWWNSSTDYYIPFSMGFTSITRPYTSPVGWRLYSYNAGSYFGLVKATGGSPFTPDSPSASFSLNPSSGTEFYPVNVTFTDTSTNSPDTWEWKINGISNSTSSSFYYTFTKAGTYNVSLYVSNSGGNSTAYTDYVVKEYVLPTCSYEFSVLQGTSPLYVSFIDTSTGSPTSYYWNFDYDDYPWIDVNPSKLNETANPAVTYTGSGIGYIYHSVTNPSGTSICPLQSYNLSGVVPTPTPTPPVPFPNQTGVCQNRQLSLGSSLTRPFDVVGEIIEPDGNAYNFYFPSGTSALTTGNYAPKIGQYYYSEKNISQQLLYQMSYVVKDCITYSPTTTYTVIPTYSRTIIPTNTPIIPTTTIQIDDNLNDTFVMPIQTFATMEPIRNTSGDVNITKVKENIISLNPVFVPYVNFTESIFYPFYTFFIDVMTPFIGLFGFVNYVNWALSTFTLMMAGFNDIMYLSLVSLNLAISNIPIKVQNVITFCLILDFIAQVRDLKTGRRL